MFAVFCLYPLAAPAADPAGSVSRVTGRATVTTANGEIRAVVRGTRLASTDMIATSAHSYARLKMIDGSYLVLRPDSRLLIEDFHFNRDRPQRNHSFMSLLKGGFRAVTGLIRNKKKYRYRTAVATIGIRGTDFSVRLCHFDCYDVDPVPDNGVFVLAEKHAITVSNNAGELLVEQGRYAYVADSDTLPALLDSMPAVFAQSPIPSADPACEP